MRLSIRFAGFALCRSFPCSYPDVTLFLPYPILSFSTAAHIPPPLHTTHIKPCCKVKILSVHTQDNTLKSKKNTLLFAHIQHLL